MMKIKRGLSAILICMMMLCAVPTVFAASVDQSVSYNFNSGSDVPEIFKIVGKQATLTVADSLLKVTTNNNQTESLKIDISDWTGASRKKGMLTYTFDYTSNIESIGTDIMVGSNSTAAGHKLGGIQKTYLIDYKGDTAQQQASAYALTNSVNKVTLQFDFSQQKYTLTVDDKTISHPFSYFADKTKDDVTYKFDNADKFVLYFRTYTNKGAYTYTIDNFKAEYTERFIQANLERCVDFIKTVNSNGSVQDFKTKLAAISDLVGSYGDYDADEILGNSDEAISQVKALVYASAPYSENSDDVETELPKILNIIKTNMPKIAVNAASTTKELEHALSSYKDVYGVDMDFIEGYSDAEKEVFYNKLLENRGDGFELNGDLAEAVADAKFDSDCYAAFINYNKAHALTLPRVFEEFKDVYEIDMSYIEDEYKNQTLFNLKTMNVEKYDEIPAALLQAYNNAKADNETFRGAYEDKLNENKYEIKPSLKREPTVLPVEDYFTDLANFDWAKEAIEYFYDNGTVAGKGERIFAPADGVTREEFVKMVVGAFNIKLKDNDVVFTDVDDAEWYAPYVKTAAEMGIIKGDSDGSFGIGENITREDVAVILYRTANVKNVNIETKVGDKFADEDKIADYAKNAVAVLRYNGVVGGVGDNMFEPKLITNRAEAAVMIYKLLRIGG